MITGFVGTPGSGKTYDAVRKIIDNLRLGRVVYTNIRGMDSHECLEMIKMLTGLSDCGVGSRLLFLSLEEEKDFWNHCDRGSLIVLDEVQNIFNARDWQSRGNVQFASWASVHRHQGYDLVIITQSIMRIDTAVRDLIEWTYAYRKVNFFGSFVSKKYICYAYGGNDTKGRPLSTSVRTYDSKIFLAYKSYVAQDIKEQGIMAHANVLKHPIFYAIPIVFSFFIYMLFNSGFLSGDFFGSKSMIEKAEKGNSALVVESPELPSKARKAYSSHTPSIWTGVAESGQTVFSNRGSNENENERKKDEKKRT